jgi:hypothetical protein
MGYIYKHHRPCRRHQNFKIEFRLKETWQILERRRTGDIWHRNGLFFYTALSIQKTKHRGGRRELAAGCRITSCSWKQLVQEPDNGEWRSSAHATSRRESSSSTWYEQWKMVVNGSPRQLELIGPASPDLHVINICFKCFKCFIGVLRVFYMML